jgi:hypothetical protein
MYLGSGAGRAAAHRENGLKLAARRRIRPQGDLRWLWRARKMFPR